MNLCRPRAARKRGQAGWRRRQIACAAEKRTGCCGRRHRVFQNNTDPKRPGGEQGGAAPQEEHYGMVAEERPQNNISRSGGIARAEATGLLHNGCLRYSRLLRNPSNDLDEAVVHEVSGSPVGTSRDVAFKGLRVSSR